MIPSAFPQSDQFSTLPPNENEQVGHLPNGQPVIRRRNRENRKYFPCGSYSLGHITCNQEKKNDSEKSKNLNK